MFKMFSSGLTDTVSFLDVAERKIYWTNRTDHRIQRANLNGSGIEDLVVGLIRPAGIALDIARGKMYWTDPIPDKIQRANLNGSNIEDLITTGLSGATGIALGIPQTPVLRLNPNVVADQTFTLGVPVSLTLPMATGGTPPYTYRTSALPPGLQFDLVDRWLSGTPTTTGTTPVTYTATDATGASASLTFTITVRDTPLLTDVYMYWTEAGNKIRRATLDGSNLQDIVRAEIYHPQDIALDMSGDKMYWTDYNSNNTPWYIAPEITTRIQRSNLDGTGIETLIIQRSGPTPPHIHISVSRWILLVARCTGWYGVMRMREIRFSVRTWMEQILRTSLL